MGTGSPSGRCGYASMASTPRSSASAAQNAAAGHGSATRRRRTGSRLIGGSEVSCEPLDRDAYGRIIARCTANGADLAAVLASEGLVWAFRRYSEDYAEAEEAARAEGVGIWQASTEPPWDYRADRWERAAEQAPDGCPIKGNINSEDEFIYHTPWSPWYGRTRISEAKGERWFCNEAEALEAGWRPARFR